MKYFLIFVHFSVAVILAGCAPQSGGPGKAGFRVRSHFEAGLNSDQGWAGAPDENVTVHADQPFRVRFSVERPAGWHAGGQFRLQYRRNQGEWTNVEAHDFPHPERDLRVDFAGLPTGAKPEGWRVVQGNAEAMVMATDGQRNVLRTGADGQPLIAIYNPPWDSTEMAAQFRLAPDNKVGLGFVLGYVDQANHFRVYLDAATGSLRISRFAQGTETILAEKKAAIPPGQWLEVEMKTAGRRIEVDFQNGTLEIAADLGTEIPQSGHGFQVPANGPADFRRFSFSGEARTPRVSIVACGAYQQGAETSELLGGSAARFQPGAGINLAERTPVWSGAPARGEFEWPLVIRRFADGAVINEEGDTFELRMVETAGTVLGSGKNPVLRLAVPPSHVGGTFVESPGRIGPWQASNGDLYFIMEPAETDNVFMMIKSADNGRTWREVDSTNRPKTNDLESVDSQRVGDTIHIIHQVTRSVRYHAFRTSDHPTHPDTWAIRDEPAGSVTAIAQAASMVVRSDGSIVAFYLGQAKNHYSIRSPSGTWSRVMTLDPDIPPDQGGPRAVAGANDTIHLAYYGTNGTVWYRRLRPDGTLTPRQQLAAGAGASRAEYGAVLPLIYIPRKNEVVVIYRLADGSLWERRIAHEGLPSPAVGVTNRKVITDAVDSQQPGADAILDGETVHVLFIEESSRSIFSTHDKGGWQPPKLQVDNIRGSWVRGNVYTRKDGVRVCGYIYDAGSDGGAGMNRFAELALSGR